MTVDVQQRLETTPPAETTKPPPRMAEERGSRLFQTMDELQFRHGNAAGTKQRLLHAAAALTGGSLLFAALYAVILLSE